MTQDAKSRGHKVSCRNCNTEVTATEGKRTMACPECGQAIVVAVNLRGKFRAVGGKVIPGASSGRQIR